MAGTHHQHTSKHTLKPTFFKLLERNVAERFPDDDFQSFVSAEDVALLRFDQPVSRLVDNHPVLCALLNDTASASGQIETLAEFRKIFQRSVRRPVPPELKDPAFTPPARVQGDLSRKMARHVLHQRALQLYDQIAAEAEAENAHLRFIQDRYQNDSAGYSYCEYVLDALRQLDRSKTEWLFETYHPTKFSVESLKRHTFICGGTGSGKSETLKYLMRTYLTDNTDCSVVLLDPHGDLALEVAQMRENATNDRLVYIDLEQSSDHRITFNPFEIADRSEASLEAQTTQLVEAFKMVLPDLTPAMENLVTHLVQALMVRPGSDLNDFKRFMSNETGAVMAAEAVERLSFANHVEFFRDQFQSDTLNPTKAGLYNRFAKLLSFPPLYHFLCGRSTLSLEQLVDQRKIVLFNLPSSTLGREATTLIGQFVTAYLQSYSMRRRSMPGNPQVPIHLFADECQYFVNQNTAQILQESRKFHLHLSLATQRIGQMNRDLKDSLLANVGTISVGRNRSETASTMAKEGGIDRADITSLPTGQFFRIDVSSHHSRQICLPFVGKKYAMSTEQWRAVEAIQRARYYRPVSESSAVVSRPVPAYADHEPAPPRSRRSRSTPAQIQDLVNQQADEGAPV